MTQQNKLDTVKKFIVDIAKYNSIATQTMKDDFISEGAVKDYVDHHSEELGENINDPEKMLTKFHLKRIGFYPDSEDRIAIFDYTIGQDLTDYLIVVSFKEDGKVNSVDMES